MSTDDGVLGGGTRPETSEDALADELRSLARTRSASQFHDHPAPILDSLPATTAGRPDLDRQQMLDRAIDAVPYDQYREAARALLGSGRDRWQPLARRGELAAAMFEVGYDGFRRAKTTAPSLFDETLTELARALLRAEHPTAGPPDDGATQAAPPGPTDHPRTDADNRTRAEDPPAPDAVPVPPRRSNRPILVGAAIVAVVLAIGIGLLARQGSGSTDEQADEAAGPSVSAEPPADDACTATVGELSPTRSDLQPFADAISAEYRRMSTETDIGCATGAIQQWDAFVFQEFTDDGTGSVLAATTPEQVMWFTDAQWSSYHQVGGKSGDNAQSLMGLIKAPEQHDGYIVVPTDTDAIMVGETADGPFFFLLGPARLLWEQEGAAAGALGLPTSNPVVVQGALTQHFTGGYMKQAPDTTISAHLVADPAAELPPLGERADGILRQTDGTAWYIGEDDHRYWIADGEAWDCKGGAGAQVANDVPGYAIATLVYGGPATC